LFGIYSGYSGICSEFVQEVVPEFVRFPGCSGCPISGCSGLFRICSGCLSCSSCSGCLGCLRLFELFGVYSGLFSSYSGLFETIQVIQTITSTTTHQPQQNYVRVYVYARVCIGVCEVRVCVCGRENMVSVWVFECEDTLG
jgi:hypothetical protein